MIKQTWIINKKERIRILELHQTATKKLYLNEQLLEKKSWRLCGFIISEQGDKYFVEGNDGETIELPKLSEVQGRIDNNNLVFDGPTKNGIEIGKEMKMGNCAKKFPTQYRGGNSWFVYYDDLESNTPIYGILGWDGSLGTGGGFFENSKIQKDKNGIVITYQKTRSKSFILEVSPAMKGNPIMPPTPEQSEISINEDISLNLESPFIFDSIALTPDAEIEFVNFMKKIKKYYDGVKGDVQVTTTASIDGDPDKIINMDTNLTRRQYDNILSNKRANEIVRRLKTESGVTSLNFIPNGIGQTNQFGPSWPSAKSNKETAPNRRLIIKLPKIPKQTN